MSLTKSQQEVWDRLKYIPPPGSKSWAYSASDTAPTDVTPGSIYFDTNDKHMMIFDGTTWHKVI